MTPPSNPLLKESFRFRINGLARIPIGNDHDVFVMSIHAGIKRHG